VQEPKAAPHIGKNGIRQFAAVRAYHASRGIPPPLNRVKIGHHSWNFLDGRSLNGHFRVKNDPEGSTRDRCRCQHLFSVVGQRDVSGAAAAVLPTPPCGEK
jgi:hypothetical protein